jgi:pantetheine-phosphate adenylyltransferase
MARVAVGGTFDPIHDGHLALLRKAFALGKDGTVVIGLTSDGMARHRTRPVKDYEVRQRNLKETLRKELGKVDFEVEKICDDYGSAITDDYDYIVVSPETEPVAQIINGIREKRGLKPINVTIVQYWLAKDQIPISSTRIARGEIDSHGELLAHN